MPGGGRGGREGKLQRSRKEARPGKEGNYARQLGRGREREETHPPTQKKEKRKKKSRVARRLVIGQPRQQQGVGADAAGERAAWQARTWCSWRRALVARTSGWRRCF